MKCDMQVSDQSKVVGDNFFLAAKNQCLHIQRFSIPQRKEKNIKCFQGFLTC